MSINMCYDQVTRIYGELGPSLKTLLSAVGDRRVFEDGFSFIKRVFGVPGIFDPQPIYQLYI